MLKELSLQQLGKMRFLFSTANHHGAYGNLNEIVLRNFIVE